MAERGIGEGDGESEGQELIERRSEEVLALTERGRINTVIFKIRRVLRPRIFGNVVIFLSWIEFVYLQCEYSCYHVISGMGLTRCQRR